MSAPTSAKPHMKDPHTDTSRSRWGSTTRRGSAASAIGIPSAAQQGEAIAREEAVPDQGELRHPAEEAVDLPGSHLPAPPLAGELRSRVVGRGPVHKAQVPAQVEPPDDPAGHGLELRPAHVVEELGADHEVKPPAGILAHDVQGPELDTRLPGEAAPGPAESAPREIHRHHAVAQPEELDREGPLTAPHLQRPPVPAPFQK